MHAIRAWFRRLRFHFWYYRSPPWDSGVSPPELMAFIQNHPPGRALDMGCGAGTNVLTLARHGWEALGVDFAPRAIALAKEKARRQGLPARFAVDDVTHLKHAGGRFDLVLDMGCFHNLSPGGRQAYVERLPDLLHPGATCLLYAFLEDNSSGAPGISGADIAALSEVLQLRSRLDTNERGKHPSVWLEFTR